jgi:hypothetical protein
MGPVEIDECEFVPYDEEDAVSYPHVGQWEYIGETEFYEGET